ncbi:MAG: hypothetical protein IJ338_01170 [Bacteroidaceae bacterium]|nr:hypothetical protein [Bacteroidaceae bacterium]
MFKRLFLCLFAVLFLTENYATAFVENHQVEFKVNAAERGAAIVNVADNINVWNYQMWLGTKDRDFPGYFKKYLPFVKYVQLMMAAGGNAERDLFDNPLNCDTLTDYNFSKLIEACRNITKQGLIPHLKIGNVPLKYTTAPKISKAFGVNVLPPDSYEMWHAYVMELGKALVKEFGKKNVRSWRFGVLTEYENKDWFSVNDNPEETKAAYFKLYDYTVDALQKAIGKDVFVGGHSMTVSDGLWDERDFISHCATGKNFCTGERGTRLCYLSSSYYDITPGRYADKPLVECISLLREHAKKEGFGNLIYGVDEGRILQGVDKKDLVPRAIGNTWQAAYDARMFKTLIDHNIDYFSQWYFTTRGIWGGIPSVSLHVANLFYTLAGNIRITAENLSLMQSPFNKDVSNTDCIAAIDKRKGKLYLMFYAYSDSVFEKGERPVSCHIEGLNKALRHAIITRTLVSDDTNFFDEWEQDQKKQCITDDDFGWSKSSFVIDYPTLKKQQHIDYFRSRKPFYSRCAELKPQTTSIALQEGCASLTFSIPIHGVVLYEIENVL